MTSLSVLVGTLGVAYALWKFTSRRVTPSRLSSVRGPEKEHWLTGEFSSVRRRVGEVVAVVWALVPCSPLFWLRRPHAHLPIHRQPP